MLKSFLNIAADSTTKGLSIYSEKVAQESTRRAYMNAFGQAAGKALGTPGVQEGIARSALMGGAGATLNTMYQAGINNDYNVLGNAAAGFVQGAGVGAMMSGVGAAMKMGKAAKVGANAAKPVALHSPMSIGTATQTAKAAAPEAGRSGIGSFLSGLRGKASEVAGRTNQAIDNAIFSRALSGLGVAKPLANRPALPTGGSPLQIPQHTGGPILQGPVTKPVANRPLQIPQHTGGPILQGPVSESNRAINQRINRMPKNWSIKRTPTGNDLSTNAPINRYVFGRRPSNSYGLLDN